MTTQTHFVIEPQAHQLDETAPLRQWLDEAKGFARPEISSFQVGALALGASGRLYMGCNLEFNGLDFTYTVHAEQFAMAMAHHAEEHGVKAVFVSALPCGHCRQFMLENGHLDLPIIVVDERGRVDVTLKDLLLFPFTLSTTGQHLFTPHSASLILTTDHADPLINAAVKIADRAYVPYTQSYAGLALSLKDGRMVTGCALESAAYNPTLSPLQMALCQLVALGASYETIDRAVLVQVENSPISFATQTQQWLDRFAPHATFLLEQAVIARL